MVQASDVHSIPTSTVFEFLTPLKNQFNSLTGSIHNISFHIVFFILIFIFLYYHLAKNKKKTKLFFKDYTPVICFILFDILLVAFLNKSDPLNIISHKSPNFNLIEQFIFVTASTLILLYFLKETIFIKKFGMKKIFYNILILMIFVISINLNLTEILVNTTEQNYNFIIQVLLITMKVLVPFLGFLVLILIIRCLLKGALLFRLSLLITMVLFAVLFALTINFPEHKN